MSFNELIQQDEVAIRVGFFFVVFTIMAIWEVIAPRRALTVSRAETICLTMMFYRYKGVL